MSQTNDGLRAVLSVPAAYQLFRRRIVNGVKRYALVHEHVRPRRGIASSTSAAAPATSSRSSRHATTAADLSSQYIRATQGRFGDRAKFYCERVDAAWSEDLVLAVGVLHHLEDAEVLDLCRLAKHALS
jgi:hypothetical protein